MDCWERFCWVSRIVKVCLFVVTLMGMLVLQLMVLQVYMEVMVMVIGMWRVSSC